MKEKNFWRELLAGRGTVPRMGPAPRNVAPPESGIVVTGPASANRTGQEDGRAGGRVMEPRRSAWTVPGGTAAAPDGGRDADVRSWKKVREEGRLTCKVS